MNSFGRIFRLSVFGESHGSAIGLVIDGVPPGISLSASDFEHDLSRRRSGAQGTTPRKEADLPKIISGIYKEKTTGAPLTILFENSDVRSSDYASLLTTPRPGHADFTAGKKFKGYADPRGGGHFSGRMTLALVAAGVVAKKIIAPVNITSEILEIGGETDIQKALDAIAGTGDSIGGIIQCTASGIPVGLGEPFFDSAESLISHLVFSIPAIKGIEFGSGFNAARMKGGEHNDPILDASGKTLTNNAGGINGGISNGNELLFRVAVKPTSSIGLPQETLDLKSGKTGTLQIQGRHDTCIALRMPVILEAATAIVLADLGFLAGSSSL
ncbi:MAG: chorismate synthase [Bacteroidetes bacterium]|nr:chorismate synthase [Bacteroidota bacterium]